jgi:hypothetical protein
MKPCAPCTGASARILVTKDAGTGGADTPTPAIGLLPTTTTSAFEYAC